MTALRGCDMDRTFHKGLAVGCLAGAVFASFVGGIASAAPAQQRQPGSPVWAPRCVEKCVEQEGLCLAERQAAKPDPAEKREVKPRREEEPSTRRPTGAKQRSSCTARCNRIAGSGLVD